MRRKTTNSLALSTERLNGGAFRDTFMRGIARFAPHRRHRLGPRLEVTQCMVGPCVARGFVDLSALRSCINVSGLCLERLVLRAIMDISAHAFSLADRPRTGH
jgi:hypothetical protein